MMIEPSNAEQATWSDATRDYVCDLQIEIKRLRALVEAAYREGYEDGEDGLGGPFEWCWEDSNTYAALQPEEGV